MALNAISNLAPALVPIVVKLIDNFTFTNGNSEIKKKCQRCICCCEAQGQSPRNDVNKCETCGRPYSLSNPSNIQYLNVPTMKTRSVSSSDSYCNNKKLERKSVRRGRSLSDSCPKRVTDEDTLVQLGRRLEKEAIKVHGEKHKLSSSSRGEIKRSIKKPVVTKKIAS